MYTVMGFDAPAMFPSNGVMTWRPLLQSSLIPESTGIVTARELASPPFEDVYIRACADEVALNQRRI